MNSWRGLYETDRGVDGDEYELWEDFHGSKGDFVAVDRKVLERTFPKLVPDRLSARAKLVSVPRAVLWEALTGKKK